jgi:uncharacterized protein (DUF697 family)/tellurite resistance protein
MDAKDRDAITAIALIAALADGRRQPEEAAELERIASELGGKAEYGAVARQVLAGKVRLTDLAQGLEDPAVRQKAYEMAVAVCHADGVADEREKTFLADLRLSLHLDDAETTTVHDAAQILAATPVSAPGPSLADVPRTNLPRPSQAGLPVVSDDEALDDLILKTSILAAALELLPQALASLAIVPVQGRMVYRIGSDFGQKLDADQITDLAGVMGIGAAAQVFEGAARRLLSGMLGHGAGSVAGAATGGALTFAATYAMGHAAKQYYAQGRQLSREDLRGLFTRFRGEATELFPRVEAAVREQAKRLDLDDLLHQLRS